MKTKFLLNYYYLFFQKLYKYLKLIKGKLFLD